MRRLRCCRKVGDTWQRCLVARIIIVFIRNGGYNRQGGRERGRGRERGGGREREGKSGREKEGEMGARRGGRARLSKLQQNTITQLQLTRSF